MRTSPNRVLALIVGCIAIAALAAALFAASRPAAELSPTSPEGVVQAYLNTVLDGDHERAATFFAADSQCDADDLDRAYVNPRVRVDLVSSRTTGDRAFVTIDVTTSSDGPFNDSYTEQHSYRLSRDGTSWRITGVPWPLYDCGLVMVK